MQDAFSAFGGGLKTSEPKFTNHDSRTKVRKQRLAKQRFKMCTLTFIPKPQGYLLGMNRDEQLTREVALAPASVNMPAVQAVYPRESSGGTWIGSNSSGVTFSLLNQNPGPQLFVKQRSRGEI